MYRHRVTIQSLVQAQDEYGEEQGVWTDWRVVWAKVEQLSGKNFFDAQRENSRVTARITLRHLSGVDSTMRFLHNGLTYVATSFPIDKGGRRRQLELMCEVVS